MLIRSSKGQSCLESYKQSQRLTDHNRGDIINIIVEETICNKIVLKPNDISGIVSDICEIFPSEKEAKVSFFIFNNKFNNNLYLVSNAFIVIRIIITSHVKEKRIQAASYTQNMLMLDANISRSLR